MYARSLGLCLTPLLDPNPLILLSTRTRIHMRRDIGPVIYLGSYASTGECAWACRYSARDARMFVSMQMHGDMHMRPRVWHSSVHACGNLLPCKGIACIAAIFTHAFLKPDARANTRAGHTGIWTARVRHSPSTTSVMPNARYSAWVPTHPMSAAHGCVGGKRCRRLVL